MASFDYSTPSGVDAKGNTLEKITLIVRDGNRYGDAVAGDEVIIDKRDYRGLSIQTTLMTPTEAGELDARRRRIAEEAAERKKPPHTVAMVERAIAEATARARAARGEEAISAGGDIEAST